MAKFEELLLAELGDFATSDLHLLDSRLDAVSLEDGDGMGDTITRVDDETSVTAVGVQGHDSLDGDVETVDVEGLEHFHGHLLPVLLGVPRSLSKEDTWMIRGGDSELVEESMVPDLLHVVPVVNDAVSDRVVEVKHTSLLLSLLTNKFSLVGDTDHGTGHLGASNEGGEDSGGAFIASNTSLHHTGAVINNEHGGSVFLFNHGLEFLFDFDYFYLC